MSKVLKLSKELDPRDKFFKVLQYGSRLLKSFLADPQNIEKAANLTKALSNARRVFRLFRGIHELENVSLALKSKTLQVPEKSLKIATRTAFFFYFIYDNLQFFNGVKIFKTDEKKLSKHSSQLWLLTILLSLAEFVYSLYKNYCRELSLKIHKFDSFMEDMNALRKERKAIILNIVKSCGDFFPAGDSSGLFLWAFGKQMDDKWPALGGLVSGAVSCYQLWPK